MKRVILKNLGEYQHNRSRELLADTQSTMHKQIESKGISIVIPVKNNQQGITTLLKSFKQTLNEAELPREVIIIDNNSSPAILLPKDSFNLDFKVHLLKCKKPGPAAARNIGAKKAKGEWLLFIDSDCLCTPQLIQGYRKADPRAIAYQGSTTINSPDALSRYYISQNIHEPPAVNGSPKYLVTANVLIQKNAFDNIGGFNENFKLAGGEDIELSLRLKKYGKIVYAPQSIVVHSFEDGFLGFVKRFIRYGKGIRQVRFYHKDHQFPKPFTANNKSVILNNFLAPIQWCLMAYGYIMMSLKLRNIKA